MSPYIELALVMSVGQFIGAYHTELSLLLGPLLLVVLYRWIPLPWWANLVLVLAAMFYLVGLWGIVLNAWAFAVLFVWLASRRRGGLRFLRGFAFVVAVILTVAAIAFYAYELFKDPLEFLGNLRNPLMYVYGLPAVLMFVLANVLGEKIDGKFPSSGKPSSGAEG